MKLSSEKTILPPIIGGRARGLCVYAIWYVVTFQPHGSAVSGETMCKYISQVRAWYQRRTRTRLGLGAEGSRVLDILKGYRRLVDQPPPLEREGCMPDDLRRGLDAVYPSDGSDTSAAWRAALTYGFATLSRGCEFALDDSRREEFESSQQPHTGGRDAGA